MKVVQVLRASDPLTNTIVWIPGQILCGAQISLVMACVNEYSFLSHLSHCDKVNFCDHTLSVIGSESVHACMHASLCASVNNFFKRHLFLNH